MSEPDAVDDTAADASTASALPQKVLVPGSAYKTLSKLRRGEEQDGDVIARAVRWLDTFDTLWRVGNPTELSFTLMDFARASNSQHKMKVAGYSDEMAAAICRALFCTQSDEDLQEAFRFYDKGGEGSVDKDELRAALPLMGEDVKDDQIDELFALVDKDKSGIIEFPEFCFLVKAMNNKGDSGFGAALRNLRMDNVGEAMSGAAGAVASSTGQAFSAMSTAWNAGLSVNPFSMRQAGSALTKMKEQGADDKTANALVQAYFSNQSEEQMKECFDELDADKSGYLDKAELRKLLPCLQELSDGRYEQMFNRVDKDKSGKIEFNEFQMLIKALGEGTWPNVGQAVEAFDKMIADGWFM